MARLWAGSKWDRPARCPSPTPHRLPPPPPHPPPLTGVRGLSADTDLNAVIRKGGLLQDVHLRSIFYQLLQATRFLHSGHVVHRDQKVWSPRLQPPARPRGPAPGPTQPQGLSLPPLCSRPMCSWMPTAR